MGELLLSALLATKKDVVGQDVREFYAINVPRYIVYRSNMRVMIHFADAARDADQQRTSITPLAPLRGQIAGLIDGWHDSARETDVKLAARLDRRVADAVVVALDNDVPAAAALLVEIRDEIIAIRRSRAREAYIKTATIALFGGLAIVGLIHLLFHAKAVPPVAILNGIGGGLLGSFFSITIGLRNRSILLDFQNRDNAVDAVLRMAVGVIGAMLIICLIDTGLVTNVQIGDSKAVAAGGIGLSWMRDFVLGFIAGFSERLIPDLLAKAALLQSPAEQTPGDAAAGVGLGAKPAPAGDQAKAGGDAGGPPDEDHCLCDAPPVPGETFTADAALPPATGRVAAAPPDQPDDPDDPDDPGDPPLSDPLPADPPAAEAPAEDEQSQREPAA